MKVLDTFSLKNRTVVVTGGAGLYGRQIVEAIAEAGARTFMASRDQTKLQAQAQKFRDAGLDVTALELDQGSEASIQSLLDQVVKQTGGVDGLINNAVLRPMKAWDYPTAGQDFARSMEVNATGIYNITRIFGQHMAGRGKGSIVNIASMQGTVGPDFSLYEGLNMGAPPDYFFHKAGMINFTRYVASQLGPKGVRCNAISPGGFFNNQPAEFVKRYCARTFLGRMADETDLKGLVVFLTSDASAYITGTNIMIDGGYTAK